VNWNETPAELARAWAEQPVIMPGPHGDLYGVFTPPAPETAAAGLCVILLGRNRWWVNRLSVKGARWLASRGFACLRFDYHGYGESEGVCEFVDPERSYPEDAIAAIRFMREEYGQRRFVLSGFCFDARTALSAVEEEGSSIEAIVAIAAPPGEKLTHITFSKIGTLLSMPVSAKKSALTRALRRRLHGFFPRLVSHPERPNVMHGSLIPLLPVSDSFQRDLRAIVRHGVRCLFINGRADGETYNFRLVERSILAKLDAKHRALFILETWPNKLHVPHDPQLQREIVQRVSLWIDGLRQASLHASQLEPFSPMREVTNQLPTLAHNGTQSSARLRTVH
jgi:alpha/beta superfamily hydrolase